MNAVTVGGGGVEYSAEDAKVRIDDLITLFEEAKEEGADYVLFLSGNHRGAQYVSFPLEYDWREDED